MARPIGFLAAAVTFFFVGSTVVTAPATASPQVGAPAPAIGQQPNSGSAAKKKSRKKTGALRLRVSSLPKGTRAKITISAHGRDRQIRLRKTRTVRNLKPGTYRLRAFDAAKGSVVAVADPARQKVTIRRSKTTKALAVSYYTRVSKRVEFRRKSQVTPVRNKVVRVAGQPLNVEDVVVTSEVVLVVTAVLGNSEYRVKPGGITDAVPRASIGIAPPKQAWHKGLSDADLPDINVRVLKFPLEINSDCITVGGEAAAWELFTDEQGLLGAITWDVARLGATLTVDLSSKVEAQLLFKNGKCAIDESEIYSVGLGKIKIKGKELPASFGLKMLFGGSMSLEKPAQDVQLAVAARTEGSVEATLGVRNSRIPPPTPLSFHIDDPTTNWPDQTSAQGYVEAWIAPRLYAEFNMKTDKYFGKADVKGSLYAEVPHGPVFAWFDKPPVPIDDALKWQVQGQFKGRGHWDGEACAALGFGPKACQSLGNLNVEWPTDGHMYRMLLNVGSWGKADPTPSPSVSTSPPPDPDPQPVTGAGRIAIGKVHTCTVRSGGAVWCWGQNDSGQLGDGTTNNSTVPVPVSGISSANQVSVGYFHSCAVKANGTAWCWGRNGDGQLGNGTTTRSSVPVRVSGLTRVTQVTTGEYHSCALRENGTVSCWGMPGQLGNGTIDGSTTPELVGLSNIRQINAYRAHTCAVDADGHVWCWGQNQEGELGNGTSETSRSPVQAVGLDDAVQVAAGFTHTCARRTGGAVSCWGSNAFRQLGLPPDLVARSLVPVALGTVTGSTQISAGEYHSCLISSGETACWGSNLFGEIGQGTENLDYDSPMPIKGAMAGVATAQVGAGGESTCALTEEGEHLWCWGWNNTGQLGNGSALPPVWRLPVAVSGF